ncbi:MAG: hypothetical protein PHI40_03880, partial [Caldisericia bacterium]|nr:hypothetical protein [Caldisericia bacterium]
MMKQHFKICTMFLIIFLWWHCVGFVQPVVQAIPYPGDGSIEGTISPVDCGRGFQIQIKNSQGDILWEGYTDDRGSFSTPYSIPEGVALVEALKIGCNAWPNPQRVNVRADKKSSVRFSCKCPGNPQKNGRIAVYMPINCLEGTSVRITGINNNQSITLTQFNTGGFFDTGCELYSDENYRVEPINSKCSFTPTSQTVKAECCPSEARVTFRCNCKQDEGRLVVTMPEECKSGTSVKVYSDQGALIKTLSGSFDTGCTLPCGNNYKVVPEHSQKSFQPSFQMVRVPCCPDYASVHFSSCEKPKGRMLVYIPQEFIQGTTIDIYNVQGSLVKTLTSVTSQAFDSGCSLLCGTTYKVVPKNPHIDFSPSSQSVELKECPSTTELHFQGSKKPEKKSRIVVNIPQACRGSNNTTTVVNIYDQSGSLVQIVTPDSSGVYDTGCVLASEVQYTVVPSNHHCTFAPSKQLVTTKPCPASSTLSFECHCEDSNGRVLVKVSEDCIVGTSIQILDERGALFMTLTSVNSSGFFDSGCTLPSTQKYEIVPFNKNLLFTPRRKIVSVSNCPESYTVSFSCEREKQYGSIAISMPDVCQSGTVVYIYDSHGDLATLLKAPDKDGIYRSGCSLLGNQSYKVVPKNEHCTFNPPSQSIVVPYCPQEANVVFDCDCAESEGSIQVHMSQECAENTRVVIYDSNNVVVATLQQSIHGVFDTGCILPCNASYKVVPENDQYTFTPDVQILQNVACCPAVNSVSFQRNHRKDKGRIRIQIPPDCVQVESSSTAIYLYDAIGNVVNILNSQNQDGYYDTGENLPCGDMYKVVPKNEHCTFSPEYQMVEIDCDDPESTIVFQGKRSPSKGRIVIQIQGDYEGAVVQIYEQDTNHLIMTLREAGTKGFDTGCLLDMDTLYHIVPKKENCSFDPPSISTQARSCLTESTVQFSIACKESCFGGCKGYFVNRYCKGASLQVIQNDV